MPGETCELIDQTPVGIAILTIGLILASVSSASSQTRRTPWSEPDPADESEPAFSRPRFSPDGSEIAHWVVTSPSLLNPWLDALELSVGARKLFFNLGEATGSIWAAEWK